MRFLLRNGGFGCLEMIHGCYRGAMEYIMALSAF